MGCCSSKRHLSREDIEFLQTHTRYDEDTIREWHEGFLQDCPTGKLYPKTFIAMYEMFFPAGDARAFCKNVFRTFDKDCSGFIDFREFLMAIDVTSCGSPEERLQWAFSIYYPLRNQRGGKLASYIFNFMSESGNFFL